jgi:hypothetical protein
VVQTGLILYLALLHLLVVDMAADITPQAVLEVLEEAVARQVMLEEQEHLDRVTLAVLLAVAQLITPAEVAVVLAQ